MVFKFWLKTLFPNRKTSLYFFISKKKEWFGNSTRETAAVNK